MTRLLALILTCVSLAADTFYVRKDGSDNNLGTADNFSGAWLTIGKAASMVDSGDTVYVRAGTYVEHVTLTRSGSVLSPITWIGESGTIIDPSIDASTGWTHQGSGVYRNSSLPYRPSAMFANGYWVMEYRWSGAWNDLSLASGSTITSDSAAFAGSGPYWDGIEAAWCWSNSVALLRFRDGADPSTRNVRISGPARTLNDYAMFYFPEGSSPLYISGSYNAVRGFTIRGGQQVVTIGRSTAGNTIGNIIENCTINHGFTQVAFDGYWTAAPTISDNQVRSCVINPKWYYETAGYPGGYMSGVSATWPAWRAYYSSKYYGYQNAKSGYESQAVLWNYVNNNNFVVGNTISNAVGGIRGLGDSSRVTASTGNTFASNSVSRIHAQGTIIHFGFDQTHVHDNLFQYVTRAFRPQSINATRSHANSRSYYYRNRIWCPPNAGGDFAYIHLYDNTGLFQSEIWFYNNSMESGDTGVTTSSWGNDVPTTLNKLYYVNNILSVAGVPFDTRTRNNSKVWMNLLRSSVTGPNVGGNINDSAYQWGGSSASSTMPDFLIDQTSLAWESGTNLTGVPLTDTRTLEFDEWDIGWHEFEDGGEQTPPVFLTAVTPEIFEGGASGTARITRSTTSLAAPLSGTWVIGGSAAPGVNYTSISGNWTIDAGQSYEDVTIASLDDGVRTGDLTITFTLNPGAGYTVAGSAVTVYFRDRTPNPTILGYPPIPSKFRPPRQ